MTQEFFDAAVEHIREKSLDTLVAKNASYSTTTDPVHNFNSGAQIMGVTPAVTAWGYMTKHLTSLRDMVITNDFEDADNLEEKCQDIINYITFIYVLGMEEHYKNEMLRSQECRNINDSKESNHD